MCGKVELNKICMFAGTLITWDIWAELHLVGKHLQFIHSSVIINVLLETVTCAQTSWPAGQDLVLLVMLLHLIAGLLYTLYGHQLWSRRDKVLRAVGWSHEN